MTSRPIEIVAEYFPGVKHKDYGWTPANGKAFAEELARIMQRHGVGYDQVEARVRSMSLRIKKRSVTVAEALAEIRTLIPEGRAHQQPARRAEEPAMTRAERWQHSVDTYRRSQDSIGGAVALSLGLIDEHGNLTAKAREAGVK